MHLLGFYNNFTTNTDLTSVRAVPQYSLTYETLAALNTLHPTIGILPSGIPWRAKHIEEDGRMSPDGKILPGDAVNSPRKKLDQFIHLVQYSDHSCFNELQEFVKLVRPLAISGSVSSSRYDINPEHYFSHRLYGKNGFEDMSWKEPRNEPVEESDEGKRGEHLLLVRKKCFKWKMKTASVNKAIGSSGRNGRARIMRRAKFGSKIADCEESDVTT